MDIVAELPIVVINFNNKLDTLECIESFLSAGANSAQLIIVDNGSTDDSVEFLKARYSGSMKIIELSEARGYANGLNTGVEFCLSMEAEWFLLTSNDILVADDFMARLSEVITNSEDYKIIGPLIFYHSMPEIVWFFGSTLLPGLPLAFSRYSGKKIDPNEKRLLVPVDLVSGCMMLIHRSVWEQIGMFDTSFFMYAEEVDFFLRARLHGFKFAAAPRMRIWHKVARTMGSETDLTQYLRTRNQIWIYRKYSSKAQRVFLFIFTMVRSVLISLSDLRKGRFKGVKAIFRGFIDGWFSKGL
jgi:hypothetical protein